MKKESASEQRKRKMIKGIIAVAIVEGVLLTSVILFLMPGMKVTMTSVYALMAIGLVGSLSMAAIILTNRRPTDDLGLPDDLRKL